MVNGHLHNGNRISKNLINLGILTGANFGEDAARYPHNIMVLDTDTLAFELIENPYAFNFYKLEVNSEKDLAVFDKLKSLHIDFPVHPLLSLSLVIESH